MSDTALNLSGKDKLRQDESSSISCLHCKTPLRKNQTNFCCSGCKVVYETIHRIGLENFYSIKRNIKGVNQSPAEELKNYSYLKSENIITQFTEKVSEDFLRVKFYLPTIHCAACVWILEKLPFTVQGVQSCRVTFSNGQIEIIFNPNLIEIDQLALLLHSIGYPPVPALSQFIDEEDKRSDRDMLMRIGVSAVCAANTMMIADSLFQSFVTGMEPHFVIFLTWASAIISLPAVAWSAIPFYRSALGTLITGRVHIDLPISIAIIVAYLSDIVKVINKNPHVYFDSITSLIFLLLFARYIQKRALNKSRSTTSSSWDLLPSVVTIKTGDSFKEILLSDVKTDDILQVRPEGRIPADGVITQGHTTIDSSFLTGESIASERTKGDLVYAGSINLTSTIELRVTHSKLETRLGKILNTLSHNQLKSTKIEDAANAISRIFTVTVLILSSITFAAWYFIDPSRAIDITVSLLVITCPCALGLAVPVTVAVALAQSRKAQIFIQNSDSLQALIKADNFYFDKTGTLTLGAPSVVDFFGDEKAKDIAKTLSKLSSHHPIARAIENYTNTSNELNLKNHELVPGRGMRGVLEDGRSVYLGSIQWFVNQKIEISPEIKSKVDNFTSKSQSTSLVGIENKCIAAFSLSDPINNHSLELIKKLNQLGKKIFILSGDYQPIVSSVAKSLNIHESNALGNLLPEDKLNIIKSDPNVKVMVGDGLNDALAMRASDISVGVRGGIESTIEAVDIFIPTRGIEGFIALIRGSEIMAKTINYTISASLAYNIIGASLAVFGYVTPLVAAILMPISSLTVILIASFQKYFLRFKLKKEV